MAIAFQRHRLPRTANERLQDAGDPRDPDHFGRKLTRHPQPVEALLGRQDMRPVRGDGENHCGMLAGDDPVHPRLKKF
jgi:hypothetical protein